MTEHNPKQTRFVFVGGVHRSGTSLLQKILDFHTEIYGGPELGILKNLMQGYRGLSKDIDTGKLSMVLSHERARQAYQTFLETLYEERLESQHRVISEKSPDNIDVFDQLAEVFPASKFIWVIRDPRDVIRSLQAVQKRSREKGVDIVAGRYLHRDLADMRRSLEAGESFLRSQPGRVKRVYSEDLVTRPREVVQDVCRFLDLEFQEQMLATERPNDTSRAIESDRPTKGVFYTRKMYDRPIDASGVGKWRDELSGWDARTVETKLGALDLPSLARYDLAVPSRPVAAAYDFALRVASLSRAVVRRLRAAAILFSGTGALDFPVI